MRRRQRGPVWPALQARDLAIMLAVASAVVLHAVQSVEVYFTESYCFFVFFDTPSSLLRRIYYHQDV